MVKILKTLCRTGQMMHRKNFIQENKETILAGNILTENTEVDQIGDN